jgi:hypothetical protein
MFPLESFLFLLSLLVKLDTYFFKYWRDIQVLMKAAASIATVPLREVPMDVVENRFDF